MNENIPLVSVCMITYNHEKYISESIEGVLMQKTTFPIELIIGEDCSLDNTRAIVKKFAEKNQDIIVLQLPEKNRGMMTNFLSVIQAAKGKYIAVCGGDDYWIDPYKLQKQVDFMEENNNCVMVHTGNDKYNTITQKFKRYDKNISYKNGNIQKEIFDGTVKIATLTTCFRQNILKNIPFNKFVELKFPIEDWPLWIFIANYGTIHYFPISTAVYRVGHISATNTRSIEKLKDRLEKEKVMYKFLCELFPNTCKYNESDLNYINRDLLSISYKMKDYDNARYYGKLYGRKSLKVICSKNKVLFRAYIYLKNFI